MSLLKSTKKTDSQPRDNIYYQKNYQQGLHKGALKRIAQKILIYPFQLPAGNRDYIKRLHKKKKKNPSIAKAPSKYKEKLNMIKV
jgi:hypothetical protein